MKQRTSKSIGRLARAPWSVLVLAGLLSVLGSHARAESVLLKNAVVHTVSGETLSTGEVWFKDGKIQAVGQSLAAPEAAVIDLHGQHLYPGLILLDSALGLSEIEAVRATQDTTEVGEFKPDVQSWIAVNPDSELIPVTRANGIAYAEPSPQGGIVSGQSGLVALDGWTTEQMTVKKPAALHLYWPSMDLVLSPVRRRGRGASPSRSAEEQAKERRLRLKTLDDFFQEARAYAKWREALTNQGPSGLAEVNPPFEGMLPALRGEVPLMIHADDVRQIKAAVKWAQTNQFKMILVGGRDAALAAGLLAAQKVPVVFESIFAESRREEAAYDLYFRTPEILRQAGVSVAFSAGPGSMEVTMARNLPYLAAQAVAFGLPENEALKTITLHPAEMLGVADRLGSIEPGKIASLFVADGSILDLRSTVKQMWIAGRPVSLETRHTRLYEKYKNRPQAK